MNVGVKILPDFYNRPEQNKAETIWHLMVRFNKRFVYMKAYGASDHMVAASMLGGELI